MKNKSSKLESMLIQLEQILEQVKQKEKEYTLQIAKVHPKYVQSARNLIHYRTLRSIDIRDLQKKLGHLGLSRLAKAAAHVIPNLNTSIAIISAMLNNESIKVERNGLSVKSANQLLKSNAKALLGYRSKGRRTRIMVTLPSEAAENYDLVHELIAKGMNCARINCAHDDAIAWKKMIENVRMASKQLKKKCKVAMDLGGPKIRTGTLVPGPRVRKYRPFKDNRGRVVAPLKLWIGPDAFEHFPHVPIELSALDDIKKDDQLYFKDARNKKRSFKILEVTPEGCFAECSQTTFLETGIFLYLDKKRQSRPIQVGEMPSIEQPILLKNGDKLRLHKENIPGEPTQFDASGNLISYAHISCTSSDIFTWVKTGEPILFDDGKIEGEITTANEEELLITIIHAPEGGGKLRSDKGINLPKSNLQMSGLTEKDKKDLVFVAKNADVVNMSFVNRPEDVEGLFTELDKLEALDKIGVILKIETQSGFNQLTAILLRAMQANPIGVMIARGDLAIECGWDNIGRVQQEILSLCQAAHITDIWATQVLENLAKRGIPSRAEITDAAMAQQADCVMLNKGPFIGQAIQLLDTILKDLEPYQEKNAPLSPIMELADNHK